MAITKEEVVKLLEINIYGILVTKGKNGMTSRTMTLGYLPNDQIFMLTHKGSDKLSDIEFSPSGLVHVSSIEKVITESYDISIEGDFEYVRYENPLFMIGKEILSKHNPMVNNILSNEETRNHYELLLLKIKKLCAWNYMQSLNGEPKTFLININ